MDPQTDSNNHLQSENTKDVDTKAELKKKKTEQLNKLKERILKGISYT